MKRTKISHKVAAMVVAGFAAGKTTAAFAQGSYDVGSLSQKVSTSALGTLGAFSTIAYIAGTLFAFSGVVKIKEHVENAAQVPLKNGLIRLGCGGSLLAMPTVLAALQGSVDEGQEAQFDTLKLNADVTSVFN